MRKSADVRITLTFLLFLILGIILFGPLAMAGVKTLLGMPTRGERDAADLTALVQKIGDSRNAEGTMESMLFIIDDKSFLAAFSKNSDQITIISRDWKLQYARPANCEKGKACMCYCRSGADADVKWISSALRGVLSLVGGLPTDKLLCSNPEKRLQCTPIDGIDFPAKISKDQFGASSGGSYSLEGGIILGPGPESAIYVEKGSGDMVGICYVRPCTS
jgi:hypothetical protein